ncbi:hypothetical protein PWT90_10416 [Aphanocladium album]|nr:hypothetical protein PWT90_10416 [Aphanocladium album]
MKQSFISLAGLSAISLVTALPQHKDVSPRHSLIQREGNCSNNSNCPAGMCCSQWGFCGSGPEYCNGSNPGNPGTPGNGGVTGQANGSIFAFGDANSCHNILRQHGACGISTYFQNVDPNSSFVAMPSGIFDRYGFAQHNSLCGKTITITHNGVTRTGVVADRNLSNDNSIDMCLDLWTAFGGRDGDGSIFHDISFSIAA